MLRQVVFRLRRKIEPDPRNPQYLQTRPGMGYVFVTPTQG
jgi:DNA-binding response OmpR family regulator